MATPGSLGILLAGGGSRRLGEPKAAALYGGVPLAQIALDKLRAVTETVGVVAATAGVVPGWTFSEGVTVRGDDPAGIGPLGGIGAGLRWASEMDALGILVLPLDTPVVPAGLLARLREIGEARSTGSNAIEAVVPRSEGPRGCEPLCAWYGTGLAPSLQAAVARGIRAPFEFLQEIPVHWIEVEEVEAFGPSEEIFHNVNSPVDLHGPIPR